MTTGDRAPMIEGSIWLRLMDDGTALLLPSVVNVEPAEGAFCATIVGLGDTLIGMGETQEEAIKSAELLLHGRVDHALENDHPLQNALGDMPVTRLPQSVLQKFMESASIRPPRRRAIRPPQQPTNPIQTPRVSQPWMPAELTLAAAPA